MGEGFVGWLGHQLPWLAHAGPWIEVLKDWWHAFESGILLLGLFWISRRLRAERLKIRDLVEYLGEKVETSAQLAKAARDAAETMASPTPTGSTVSNGSLAHWEQLRSDWHDVRERIELAVEGIKHKSVRGKYAKIDRYSYRDIIVTLREDEIIKAQAEAALLNMNQRFMALKTRPSQTTANDVAAFEGWMRQVNGSLPKRKNPIAGTPPPLPLAQRLEAAE